MKFETRLDKMPRERKIVLVGIFLVLAIIAGRLSFLLTRSPKGEDSEKVKVDYKEVLKTALENYEDAEGSLIYKDTKKTRELLAEAKNQARQIKPESELYQEAQDLLGQIKTKEEELKELEAEIKKKEEKAKAGN